MQQIRTPFGLMPMTDEEYSNTYEGFLQAYAAKDLEGVFNGGTRMLMSLTTIIELQQRLIGELAAGAGTPPEVAQGTGIPAWEIGHTGGVVED